MATPRRLAPNTHPRAPRSTSRPHGPLPTTQNRTGIHNSADTATGGTLAMPRDCTYYGCRGGGWHEADCSGAGLTCGTGDRVWDRRGDERVPARRHVAKKGGSNNE